MSREAKSLAYAVILHSYKTSAEDAIAELKRFYQCTLDSQKQSHSPLAQSRIPMNLLNPETGEIHTLSRIPLTHRR